LRKGGGGLGWRVVEQARLALLVVAPVLKLFDLTDDAVDVATNVLADVVPPILFLAEIALVAATRRQQRNQAGRRLPRFAQHIADQCHDAIELAPIAFLHYGAFTRQLVRRARPKLDLLDAQDARLLGLVSIPRLDDRLGLFASRD
jgi:hypothetical protein